jgi:transcriptional regulator with XRE-family HTH domain/mannose-6-phosphate isomerase-like protein (cupin superfamily)
MDNASDTGSKGGAPLTTSAESASADSGDNSHTLGSRLRQARLQANLSLREMARQLGVSASFVSQLENGKSQPSVATLYSLAQFLGVSMDRLFEIQEPPATAPQPGVPTDRDEAAGPGTDGGGGDATPVRRVTIGSSIGAWDRQPEDHSRLSMTAPGHRTKLVMDSGVIWEQLARKTDHLDFMEIMYPAGSSSTTDGRMLRHDDYEYGYLLEGELEVTIGFDVMVLRAGEAIGFDSSVPHLFKNLGTTPARGIWVVHHRHE